MAKSGDRERAKEYLLANPQATNRDASSAVGCSPRTVGYARAELVGSGQLPPAWGDHKSNVAKRRQSRTSADTPSPISVTSGAAEGTPFDTQSTADLNAALARQPDWQDIEAEDIDISKLKRILWRIARTDPDNRIRTQAIWTLTRIQNDMDDRPLGPGQPRTKADIIDRLLLLFEGVGAGIVVEAMQAFLDKRKGTPNATGVEAVEPS
jgi:hypothetical protein